MPYSYQTFAGGFAGLNLAVSIPFLLRDHISLYTNYNSYDGTYDRLLVIGTDYAWISDTQIQLLASAFNITVKRKTPTTELLVSWTDGSNVDMDDLLTADRQNLYAVQEQEDSSVQQIANSGAILDQLDDVLPYTLVGTVATIPTAPTNGQRIEIGNSTGIESFSPLTGRPSGFVGASNLFVRLVYTTTGNTWQWVDYRPVDPDGRYAGINFAQSGANAIARTITSKLRETVSVKDFGAVGDGIANDTTAIANAIASARGIVYFPEGIYKVTSGFTASQPIKIQGEGSASLISFEGTGTLFTFTYSQGGFANQDITAPYSIDSIYLCKTASAIGEVAECCVELRYTGTAGVIGFLDKLHLNNVTICCSAYPSNPLGTRWNKGLYLNRSAGVSAVNLSIVNNSSPSPAGTPNTYGIHIKNDLAGHNMVRTFSSQNIYISVFDKCVFTEGNASANGGIESLYFSQGELIGNYGIYTNKGDAITLFGLHIDAKTQAIQFNNSSVVRVVGCDIRSQYASSPTANALVYWSGGSGTWVGNNFFAEAQTVGVLKFFAIFGTVVGNFMSGRGGATDYGITLDSESSEIYIGQNIYANLNGRPSVLNNSLVNTIYIDPMLTTAADGSLKTLDGRFWFTGAGFLKASQSGSYIGGSPNANYEHQFTSTINGGPTVRIHNYNSSFSNDVTAISTDRSNSSAFTLLQLFTSLSGTPDAEFKFRGDGNAFCDGSWAGGGADYAEYFEWLDGNPGNEDRRGFSVTLVGDKIKKATANDVPIGVISGNPSVVGDAAWNKWQGKYLCDDYGSYILEDYEVEDEDGNTVTQQRRKLNPIFNPNVEYIPRADRPEWDCVGLVGKLTVRKGQPIGSSWRKLRDTSSTTEQWLVR